MIDDIDKKILTLLTENSRIAYTEISKKVHLSRTSVVARFTRLVQQGVIKRFTTELDRKKIGKPIQAFLHLSEMKRPVNETLQALNREEVTRFYLVTGENDYIINVALPDMESMEKLLNDLVPYGRVRTSVVITEYESDQSLIG